MLKETLSRETAEAAPGPSSALNCSQNLRRDRFCFSRLAGPGRRRERRRPDRSLREEEFILILDKSPTEVLIWRLTQSLSLGPSLSPADQQQQRL